MQLYIDTSALVKLVVAEAESTSLRRYLGEFGEDTRITSALARTELIRAVARQGSLEIIQHARRVVGALDLVALTTAVLDRAGEVPSPELRTLDAIHLSAALTAPDLRALVTYDARLGEAATNAGITVVDPR
ncbi:type II toxin-antitoxin system VapC family toxin [Mycolicibacterium sp. CR10]|uniref:type II toxin-antitoxin system VapC family toxin n=1 Tax=Mycolicibacterium sp. CR10 TaxID=2562314 RepID=UPI0010C11564|nr:type II toxin-antitoxin system VapC family toxin [Mycolicibacterium sp. CR10]